MILLIAVLLSMESVFRRGASCSLINEKEKFATDANVVASRRDDSDSVIDELRDARNPSTSTKSSTRVAYERAINRTVDDYYAQRSAVMERYYARQREINDKFGGKTTTRSSSRAATTQRPIIEDDPTRAESTTVTSKIWKQPDKDDSVVYRNDRGNDGERRVRENATDSGVRARSSNIVADRSDPKGTPGYYRLGEFRGSENEKIVYQHNLGVGLEGPSRLEANFEVVLEGAFAITVIEAFPYADTRAHFSWISGGPGSNSVKLKLEGYDNEGFSYTVKVWAVPA